MGLSEAERATLLSCPAPQDGDSPQCPVPWPGPALPNGLTYLSLALPPTPYQFLEVGLRGKASAQQPHGGGLKGCVQGAAPFVPSPVPTPACVGRYGASGLQPGVSSVAWRDWLAQVGTALDPRQQNQASVGGRLLTS